MSSLNSFLPLGHTELVPPSPSIVYSVSNASCEPGEIILGITVTPRTQRKLASWVEIRRKLQSSEQHFDNVSCISCVQRTSCVTSLDLQEEKKKLFTLIFLHFVGVRITCKCWFLNLVLIIDWGGCWGSCDNSGWPLCYMLSILISSQRHTGFTCLVSLFCAHFVWINGSIMWLCIAQGSRERIVTFWGNEWVEWCL